MVTEVNPTPHTRRPMHSRETLPTPTLTDSTNTGPSVQEAISQNTTADLKNCLADVLVSMHNRPSAQTLMVRPVITTTRQIGEIRAY